MNAQLRTALNATLQTEFGSRSYVAALWCAAWAEAYLSSTVVDDVSVVVATIVTAYLTRDRQPVCLECGESCTKVRRAAQRQGEA
jgi:hypothetical protein